LHGIDSIGVTVEADVSDGLPVFDMVGFLAAEVREARERVRTAIKNSGYRLPAKRITINLSPGSIKKTGTGFDLPVAIALLSATGVIDGSFFHDCLVVGELGLDGSILPIRGALSIVLKAKEDGMKSIFLPNENLSEARLINGIKVYTADSVSEIIENLKIKTDENDNSTNINSIKDVSGNFMDMTSEGRDILFDFSEINGQKGLKRACEVAVAGRHNLLMVGPPGSGKTFAAKCIPGILPKMSETEMLEVATIYSAKGEFQKRLSGMYVRPFRSPHHTVTAKGLSGGGQVPHPGEITLAHKGILFLDELTEYNMSVLETLREPLEEKCVNIVRANGNYIYPADFMLVAAMNPCSCGYFPDRNMCSCTPSSIFRYLGRLSQPLLDRIDITVHVPRLGFFDISTKKKNETSKEIRKRVSKATEIQAERYEREDFNYNSEIPASRLEEYINLTDSQKKHLSEIYEKYNISLRSYHKLLKTIRTIADLDGQKDIKNSHINEAICYRSIDKKEWEKNI